MNNKPTDFDSIVLRLASPDDVMSWSYGEVTKPETINYRSQRSERGGLFCEKIFGPDKDFECYCGKYKKVRYKGVVCEKCGVEVTRSIVRRERMGHISLASPVSHIWFLRGIPSRIGMILDVPLVDLEKVIYFSGYIITKINQSERENVLKNIDIEYKTKLKVLEVKEEKDKLKKSLTRAKGEIEMLKLHHVLTEAEYYSLSKKYGEVFEVGTGAETVHNIFKSINMEELEKTLTAVAEKEKEEDDVDTVAAQEQGKALKRLNLVKAMRLAGVRPEWMFLTVLPVIPPALRPMVTLDGGRHATSDLNDLYRRVINRNNRLKKLIEIRAPDVICRNEKRILQEAVDALIDNSIRRGQGSAMHQGQKRPLKSLADMLKGKSGRFRQNLLGKRVDYSARSVIVVGPELKLHQCGLPKYIALELFRPFVIAKLLKRELAYNIRRANHLIEEKVPEVWAILEEVIKDKYVLLNRAPTLHRLGIQAFQPILVEGKAIRIHPLVCSAFNADFDGDQMAVHVPLGEEAQREAKDIMLASKNLLKPGDGNPVVNPSQDIVLGCCWLTLIDEGVKGEGKYFSSPNDSVLARDFGVVDLRAKVHIVGTSKEKYSKFEGKPFETTVGRILFNSVFPEDFPYFNDAVSKKSLSKMVQQLIEKYGPELVPDILDKIKNFGYEYATESGISWGIDDVQIPKNKPAVLEDARKSSVEVQKQFDRKLLTENERYNKIVEIWQGATEKVVKEVPHTLDKMGSVYNMVNSGARGSWIQVGQMAGMKGLVSSPSGKIIEFAVESNYKEGLNVLEYFVTTHGARKGEVDTALKTAKAGYLTRRLVSVGQDIIVKAENCDDEEGILISKEKVEAYGSKFANRIFGRTLAQDAGKFKKGHLLSMHDAVALEELGLEDVRIFSPITCGAHRGVCQKCYGYDLGSRQLVKMGEAVGIVAAQAIGEPGTQLTMRTFHVGGVASGSDITMGLPRVEEIFERRVPRNPAVICDVDGPVLGIKSAHATEGGIGRKYEKIVTVGNKDFQIPYGRTIVVTEGQEVKKGDVLTDGASDIRELFRIGGRERTQNYILHEISKVYITQGASINEKHIEVIVRQMFSRYRIKDPGDTKFSRGNVVERSVFLEENARVRKVKGEEATALALVKPIGQVSLSTASFLASASFQDTARVLIKTSLESGEDHLYGLKENVIVGKLIPAGTGARGEYIRKEESKFDEDETEE